MITCSCTDGFSTPVLGRHPWHDLLLMDLVCTRAHQSHFKGREVNQRLVAKNPQQHEKKIAGAPNRVMSKLSLVVSVLIHRCG